MSAISARFSASSLRATATDFEFASMRAMSFRATGSTHFASFLATGSMFPSITSMGSTRTAVRSHMRNVWVVGRMAAVTIDASEYPEVARDSASR